MSWEHHLAFARYHDALSVAAGRAPPRLSAVSVGPKLWLEEVMIIRTRKKSLKFFTRSTVEDTKGKEAAEKKQ